MEFENIRQLLLASKKVPVDTHDLYAAEPETDAGGFEEQLKEFELQGLIMRTNKGKWALPWQLGYAAGRMQRTERGFGFVIPNDDYFKKDIFIPAAKMMGAMNGDTVLAVLTRSQMQADRPEGVVYKILKRGKTSLVGRLEIAHPNGFVIPDDRKWGMDVFVPKHALNGAADGQKVIVRIDKWAEGNRNPEGTVEEILGNAGDVGVDILCIIKELGLKDTFPDEVLAEADRQASFGAADLKGRLDLRNEKIFTIDGADAKDLDDAISVDMTHEGHYRLGVHIADVSNYVRNGTPLDMEARRRATSVYLIDRVVPMLPQSLSNGICSLNPHEDRLTVSAFMTIDHRGRVRDSEIALSVINSCHRLTYDEVNRYFDGDSEVAAELSDIAESLDRMQALSGILTHRRIVRGSLELNIDEPHFELDERGVPVSVLARERGKSHRMIEEFMLCANETVAEFVGSMGLPLLYRVHETPDPEKLAEFAKFCGNLGYPIKGSLEGVHPKALQQVLKDAEGKPEEGVISRVMLRTLQKARYSPVNVGHFGLASSEYCHFTSPIRRYPDLVVHRVLKAQANGDTKYLEALEDYIAPLAAHCSQKEKEAMEAERTVDDLKMTEFMSRKIGEEFDGIISGVTDFGMFVELENTIEGLVRITALEDDYYVYDEKNYMLTGRHTGKVYRLGGAVRVRCIRADVASSQIDFELVNGA